MVSLIVALFADNFWSFETPWWRRPNDTVTSNFYYSVGPVYSHSPFFDLGIWIIILLLSFWIVDFYPKYSQWSKSEWKTIRTLQSFSRCQIYSDCWLLYHHYCSFSSNPNYQSWSYSAHSVSILVKYLGLLHFYLCFLFWFLCYLGMSKLWLAKLTLTQFSAKTLCCGGHVFSDVSLILLWGYRVLTSLLTFGPEPQSAQCRSTRCKCFHYSLAMFTRNNKQLYSI